MSIVGNIRNIGSDETEINFPIRAVEMQILKARGFNINEKLLWNSIGRELLYSILPNELVALIGKASELKALEDDSTAFAAKLKEFTPEEKQELMDIGYLQEETPSVQPQTDSANEETASSGEGMAIEDLIKKFLTKELMAELTSKVETMPKSTPLETFKKEIIKVLGSHIKPSALEGCNTDDRFKRWSIDDMSSILSIDMLSEFAQSPNTKKKVAIESAVNKYGKATMVIYGMLISNIASQLVMGLYE